MVVKINQEFKILNHYHMFNTFSHLLRLPTIKNFIPLVMVWTSPSFILLSSTTAQVPFLWQLDKFTTLEKNIRAIIYTKVNSDQYYNYK